MTYWTEPENQARGDSPYWQPPKITEMQQHEAALYITQCRIRADEELARLQAELDEEKK